MTSPIFPPAISYSFSPYASFPIGDTTAAVPQPHASSIFPSSIEEITFKVKGFKVALRIVEREQNRHIKIAADEENGVPVDFSFWIQMQPVDTADTRIRMVLHAELNTMMKMMIGSKIQGGLDKAVEGLAIAFNQIP